MECDLCRHDCPDDSSLCENCADAIRRLVTIQRARTGNNTTSSAHVQPDGLKATKIGTRDA